jgi:WD40 repeat protein
MANKQNCSHLTKPGLNLFQQKFLKHCRMYVLKTILCLLAIAGSMSGAAYGQDLSFVREIKIQPPVSVSIDRYNHIFTSNRQGNVHKYDSTGKLLQVYSPQKAAGVTLIEAWQTMQIFLFQRDLQKFTFLDRFLADTRQAAGFDPGTVGFARAATMASDGQLWLFDESDFSLKKLNPSTQRLTVHVPLGLILSAGHYMVNYMREYQNLLFVNDIRSGILVFDNFGNYKKTLPFTGITQFGCYNNELYFLDKHTIHFFDLYTLSSRFIRLPHEIHFDFVLVSETQAVLFSGNSLYIYRLNVN